MRDGLKGVEIKGMKPPCCCSFTVTTLCVLAWTRHFSAHLGAQTGSLESESCPPQLQRRSKFSLSVDTEHRLQVGPMHVLLKMQDELFPVPLNLNVFS